MRETSGFHIFKALYAKPYGMRLLYVNDSQTVRSAALNTLTCSLVNNNALVAQVLGNNLGTSLRELLAELLATLRRSCSDNLHVATLLNGVGSCLRVSGQSALALCESNDNSVGGAVGVNLLDNLLDNLLRLLG